MAAPNFIEVFKWQIQAMDNYVQMYKKNIEKCTRDSKQNFNNYDSIFKNSGMNGQSKNNNEQFERTGLQDSNTMSIQSPIIYPRNQNATPVYKTPFQNNIIVDKKKLNGNPSNPIQGIVGHRPISNMEQKHNLHGRNSNIFKNIK